MVEATLASNWQVEQPSYCLVTRGNNGAPNWIRTSGPQIRNLMLYPAELWVRRSAAIAAPDYRVNF
jgi:hypothetical protein